MARRLEAHNTSALQLLWALPRDTHAAEGVVVAGAPQTLVAVYEQVLTLWLQHRPARGTERSTHLQKALRTTLCRNRNSIGSISAAGSPKTLPS